MTDRGSLVDLDLTSDDPREFVGELARLKITLLDREIVREISESGTGSREVQQLLTARRAFQDMLARLGLSLTGATAATAPAPPAAKTAAAPAAAAPAAPAPGGNLAARLRQEKAKATGMPSPAPAAEKTPAPAAEQRPAPAAAPAPARPVQKLSLTERLQREEIRTIDAEAARRPQRTVISDDDDGTPALPPAPAESAPAPLPSLALPKREKSTLCVEAVASIEKKAREEGFLDTKEMLWLKRGRLREQIQRLEETGADPRQLTLLKNELEKINFLLDGGLEQVKAQGVSAKAEKQAAVRQQLAKKQEALRTELSGLLDEIQGGSEP